jgi:hypothetical protein
VLCHFINLPRHQIAFLPKYFDNVQFRQFAFSSTCSFINFLFCQLKVKNLFGIQDVYLQVLWTRLTLVIKTQLFLKLTYIDKNWLAAFQSFNDKENCFRIWEMQVGVVDLDSFLSLPTDCCQLVTNMSHHFWK